MRHTAGLTAVVSMFAFAPLALAQTPNLLWYEQPATDWEKEALPIGNGRIGAMVFGGVDSERLQVAEKSLWTGGPGTEGGYDYGLPAASQVELMRSIGKQLAEGARLEPEAVARQLGRKMHNYGDYQSFGDLIVEAQAPADGAPVTDYRRELDLDTAVARVKFKQGGMGFRREYFVSFSGPGARRTLVCDRHAETARALHRAGQPQRRSESGSRDASASPARSSPMASSTPWTCA